MSAEVKKNVCCRCFQPAPSLCTLCKSAYYCGKICQKKDWELGHKVKCKEIRAAAAAAAAAGNAASPSTSSSSVPSDVPNPSSSPSLPDGETTSSSYSSASLKLPSRWIYSPGQIAKLFTNSPTYPAVPVGLLNPKRANSCFYNVVLQSLMYTRPFVNLLDSLQHQESECKLTTAGKFCIICSIGKHRTAVMTSAQAATNPFSDSSSTPSAELSLSSLSLNKSSSPKPLLPVDLLRNLDKLNSDYALGQQEDSHDTIKCFLHLFDDCWSKNQSALQVQPGQPPLRLSQRTLETTPISQLFGGYLLSELKCASASCGKFTSLFEFFLDLSLEIIEATDDLNEMLEAYTRVEKLDANNLYKCGHCSKATRARKQITIFQQPNVCMIQLKRFRMGLFGKVNKWIRFPLELSLRKYMSHCKLDEEEEWKSSAAAAASTNNLAADGSSSHDLSTVYKLYAVIVHLDLMNVSSFGHYICYIRVPTDNNNWYRFDDETITKVSVQEVLKQNAYVLFYERSAPFVSEADVSNEDETAAASPPPAGSPALEKQNSGEGGSSTPAAAAAEVAVQCVGGCGFWGKSSTNNMCSQCYKKWQISQGIAVAPPVASPSPKPGTAKPDSDDDDDGGLSPEEAAEMRRRLLANPMMMQALLAQSRGGEAPSAASMESMRRQYAMQGMMEAMENQRKVEQMQREQIQGTRSNQLPQNPLLAQQAAASNNSKAAPAKKMAAGRNDPCPCGSGRKFKVCHGK